MPSQKITELTDKMGALLEEIEAHLSNLQPEERALLDPDLDQFLLAVSKLRHTSQSGTTADESPLLKISNDEQKLLEEERQQCISSKKVGHNRQLAKRHFSPVSASEFRRWNAPTNSVLASERRSDV